MRLPFLQTSPLKLPDWVKVTLIALVIPTLVFLWAWVFRPFFSAVVWHLLDQKPEKKSELFLSVLEDSRQQPRLKKISEGVFGDRIEHVDRAIEQAVSIGNQGIAIGKEALELALANRDAIEAFREIAVQQGAAIEEVRKSVGGLPQLMQSLDRGSEATERLVETVHSMEITISRIDERQQAMKQIIERRTQQSNPHPQRRSDDLEEDRS
jgi:hypothetical protein